MFNWVVYIVCVVVVLFQFIVGNGQYFNVCFIVFFIGINVVFVVNYYFRFDSEDIIGVILLFVFGFVIVVICGDDF